MIRRLNTQPYCHDLVFVGAPCAPHPHLTCACVVDAKLTCPTCFDSCPSCAQSVRFTWICISDSPSKPQCASYDLNAIRQWECNHDVCALATSRCMRYAMHKHQYQKSTPSMAPWVSHQHVQMSKRARDKLIGTPSH